ncbi:MAG: hypothetical protein U0527_14720 [Candidatus Eisenbacteria bacterium]
MGYYDTYPGTGSCDGAWGVYPFAQSGNYYISDMQTGLYVFRFTPNYGTVAGTVTNSAGGAPLAGVTVTCVAQGKSTTTDPVGHYCAQPRPWGRHRRVQQVRLRHRDAKPERGAGSETTQNVALTTLPTGTLSVWCAPR